MADDSLRWLGPQDWTIQPLAAKPPGAAKPRRHAVTTDEPLGVNIVDDLIEDSRFTVLNDFLATPSPRITRGGAQPELAFEVDAPGATAALLAIRHPSGAVSFHPPEALKNLRRSGKSVPAVRFRVELRGSSVQGKRRGAVTRTIRAIVFKVTGTLADLALPKLVRLWEERAWTRADRHEGWKQVTRESLLAGKLKPALPPPGKRSLLLIHGTFSNGAAAYSALANSNFFVRVAQEYDNRVYAFDHFTISRTPDENAAMLLEALDSAEVYDLDVVTHSRGGLVLRTIAERPDILGALAGRVRIGKAVLVASPNDGTPLATADRWQQLLNWVANLLELFPVNPWTEASSWIVDGLVWIANRVSGGIPGIGAMDSGSQTIGALQDDPGPPRGAYSALVANFRADDGVLERAIDVGADLVFATANDLVVPTEGGWRTGKNATDFVSGDRIGCFGLGGNLLPSLPNVVTHINFFDRPETVEFLVRALTGKPQQLSPIVNDRPLPNRRAGRVLPEPSTRIADTFTPTADQSPVDGTVRTSGAGIAPDASGPLPGTTIAPSMELDIFDGGTPPFHLILLPEPESDVQRSDRRSRESRSAEGSIEEHASSQLLATFGSARVLEPFFLRGSAGQRWHDIIAMQIRLQKYVDGNPGSTLPTDQELIVFGTQLFETLFPAGVRRLYDEARARAQGRRLDIIFTSMISWVADKPWEFAYDPLRKSFLATEDIQFVRNVLTAVPAQNLPLHYGALRILVAVAQPIGQAKLSSEEEITVIRRGFEPLIAAGLARVEVLPRATPNSLHGRLSTDQFDVVHFIGHGEFDPASEVGKLIFEDDAENVQPVTASKLRTIFCQRGVRLLFLNACETGRGGRADFNRGVAPAVVAGGMPVVVANQFKVLDVSATSFAQHFYWSLAAGLTIGDAARESRIAVNYSLTGEAIDWAVPVVYARDPNARFCKPSNQPSAVLTAVTPTSARRSQKRLRIFVGLWDIQHHYPQLEDLADQWNKAQDTYQFKVVDPSVPIGGWQVIERDNRKMTYLRADVLVNKLQSTARQLEVESLVCISTTPMTDGEEFNLYTYTGESVILLSTWGFKVPDQMIPRLMTNLVAGELISQRGNLPSSMDVPKNSPFYFNEERDIRVLLATQQIDANSRKTLEKNLGERAAPEIGAVEKLLSLFQEPTVKRRSQPRKTKK